MFFMTIVLFLFAPVILVALLNVFMFFICCIFSPIEGLKIIYELYWDIFGFD